MPTAGPERFGEGDAHTARPRGRRSRRALVGALSALALAPVAGCSPGDDEPTQAPATQARAGVVGQIDGTRIVVRATEETDPSKPGVDIYRLQKFQRSNQNTCINQRPLVRMGDRVNKGDIIADGPSTDLGDLALGRNVLVAFMPWNGYNYEDSILLSERIVADDVFTSIHIEEFEVMARDTKLGPEEITRDIPNVSEEALKNLDEAGIVYIGAEVQPGDILVGKITPKGESPMTPEEKLLRAIFGEKASDVRDTSMRMPPGTFGTVVEVRVFNRHGVEKDERAMAIEREEIERLAKDRDDEQAILDRNVYARLSDMLVGKDAIAGPKGFKKGSTLARETLDDYPRSQWWQFAVEDEMLQGELEALRGQYDDSKKALEQRFMDKVEKVQRGDEMPPGVMKMVKVFVAVKRKMQPGDKMAGRHGNKGVVSRIVPVEDMPFLEDGTHVDIVLNPLGVPSRMNVGQILETHLGWACAGMGRKIGDLIEAYKASGDIKPLRQTIEQIIPNNDRNEPVRDYDDESIIRLGEQMRRGVSIATPVFDGAHEANINEMLEQAGLHTSGQSQLYDGRTGEPFGVAHRLVLPAGAGLHLRLGPKRQQVLLLGGQQLRAVEGEQRLALRHEHARGVHVQPAHEAVELHVHVHEARLVEGHGAHRAHRAVQRRRLGGRQAHADQLLPAEVELHGRARRPGVRPIRRRRVVAVIVAGGAELGFLHERHAALRTAERGILAAHLGVHRAHVHVGRRGAGVPEGRADHRQARKRAAEGVEARGGEQRHEQERAEDEGTPEEGCGHRGPHC